MTAFPAIGFFDEATYCINEEVMVKINEVAIGAIKHQEIHLLIFSFHVLLFQLYHQLIDSTILKHHLYLHLK